MTMISRMTKNPDQNTNEPDDASACSMPDVQGLSDRRRLSINRVGVKNVTYPITLRTPDGGTETTVASIDMYVSLRHDRKGTHMSRFLEVLNENRDGIRPYSIISICRQLRHRLDAEEAHVRLDFTYFIEKKAPITGLPGLMNYQVIFECAVDANDESDFVMGVSVNAASLCPCSKEISEYGAHNQRCLIEAEVRYDGEMWIEDLVEILESAASAPVYSVLKRPDEKYITELAFDQPKFVEDIVRDAASSLNADERVVWYSVRSENFESIHSHNAYATITRDKRE